MNDYFNTFQTIEQSVEQLLTGEQNSPEIEQSAISLRESVQPCIEELKQSSIRLEQLVQVGFEDLYRAEDIWNSKLRIAEAAKDEIWEQIGEISGSSFRTRNLATQYREEAVKKARQSWDKQVEYLRNKWFIDAENGKNKDLVTWKIDDFIQDLHIRLYLQSQDLNVILKKILRNLHQELKVISLSRLENCINLLDQNAQSRVNSPFNQIFSEFEEKFSQSTEFVTVSNRKLNDAISSNVESLMNQVFLIPSLNQKLADAVNSSVENLMTQVSHIPGFKRSNKQGIFSISWHWFTPVEIQIIATIDNIITEAFDARVGLVTQALEQVIAFYNYFLERQDRYQQETPEQREAEKAWIDQQRRELDRVQKGLEAILNTD
jgi:hypothetical protein